MRRENLDRKLFSSANFFPFVFFGIIAVCYARIPCPTLSLLPGTVVNCELPKENNRTVDCTNGTESIPRGTLGRYRCERVGNFSDNILKCGCKGKWRGIALFNDFMSNCNISDYSLEGPSELNLTEREIRQLTLSSPVQSNVQEFQEDGAAYHNFYQTIHHSPALELNQTLSEAAQKWAEQQVVATTLKTQDWSERWYSQNLYRVTGAGLDAREAVKLAVAAWYQGAYSYNWENPSGLSAFTQLVWKSTTDVGIGVAQRGNLTMVVANYYPPGNVIVSGRTDTDYDKWAYFRLNVLPPNSVNGNNNNTTTETQNVGASSTSSSISTTLTTTTTTASTTTTTTEVVQFSHQR